jgi:hemophore
MQTITRATRQRLAGVFAVTAVGGALVAALAVPATPSADAATDPCAASEVARSIASVAVSTANYLDAHPDVNNVLTTASQQQSGPQGLASLKTYFDANPQVGKDMQGLQQPLMNLSSRCKLPLTPTQLMGLLQGAQSPATALAGTPPNGLPGASPVAQSVGGSGPLLPAESSPAAATAPGAAAATGSTSATPR